MTVETPFTVRLCHDTITLTRGCRGITVTLNGALEHVLSYEEFADRLAEPPGVWGLVVNGTLHETHLRAARAQDRAAELAMHGDAVTIIRIPERVNAFGGGHPLGSDGGG